MARLLTFTFLFITSIVFGQNNFRSRQSGDWNQSSSWEEFISGSWQITGNTPTSASGSITIRNSHTITVTTNVTIDRTTIDIGGVLVVNDGVALTLATDPSNSLTCNGTLMMLGESFLTGTGNVAIAGNLSLGSLNGTGAIVTGTTFGNIRVNRGFISGANIIYEGTGPQFVGDGTPATAGVNTIINNLSGVLLNNTTSSLVSISGNLTIQQGNLTVQNNNLSVNSATSTINLNGGDIFVTSAGTARTLTARNISHNGGNIVITSGLATTSCTINGTLSLNSGDFTINSSSVTSTLTTNGAINFNGGDLNINSGSENATLNVYGDITGTGSAITFSGANANLNIYGTGQLSQALPLSSTTTLEAFIIDRPNCTVSVLQPLVVTRSVRINNGNLDMDADITVNANVDINSGSILFFEDHALSIAGTFNNLTGYTGVLSSNSSSSLFITGTGAFNTLAFSGGGNTVGTLQLNRPTGGTLVTLNSSLTISSLLYLTDGSFYNISGLSMASGAVITVNSNASLTGAAPTGGPYNVVYEGSSPLSTQSEAQGSILNMTNSAVTVSVTVATTITGILTLNSGTVSNGAGLLSMGNGSSIVRNASGNFGGVAPSGGPYNLTYNGASYSTGVEANGAVSNLTTNLTGTLTLSSALSMNGTLLVSAGTFSSGANQVTTNILQNQSVFNAPSVNLILTGNLINNGTFNSGSGTVVFNGATILQGTSINATNFNNLTVNPAASLEPSSTLNILGNFTNNGSFIANTGTVIFGGTVGSKLLAGSSSTQFYNLTLNKSNAGVSLTVNSIQTVVNALTLTAGQLSNIAGNLSLNNGATLTKHSSGSITTSSPGGGPWNLVYVGNSQSTSLEIPSTGAVITLTLNTNNSTTVTLTQALTVSGLFSNPSTGRVFTCGANNVSVGSLSNSGTFNAPNSSATTGLTLLGNFVNNGTFVHNSGTVVVGASVAMSGTNIDATNFNNITISAASGTLTPSAVLGVQGNFTNNGSFVANSGTVNFNGTVGAKILSGSTNTQFFNLILNKSNVGVSLSVTSSQSITNSLTLTAGLLDIVGGNLVMSNPSTITRNAGTISTSSPSGGPWQLVYTGGAKTTGLEIPSSTGVVESLTVNTNASTIITLSQNLTVNGLLSIIATTRTFTANGFNVTTGSFSNAGTFNAPTAAAPSGFTISGSFVNDGTFAAGNGTVFINGPVTMSGSTITTTTFNDLTIQGTGNLTPASVLNISGSFANNGTLTQGTGSVVFTGNNGSKTISGTTNTSFYNLTLNKSNVGLSLTVSTPQTVTNSLTLTAGQLSIPSANLSMNSGTTLFRNSGSAISTNSPGGGPWNLIYTGGNLTTGLEIPTSGSLASLTVNSNSAATVTLGGNVTITGALTINAQATGPTFTSGARAITTSSIVNGGIFNAPTSSGSLTMTGDITNNGTFNGTTGTTTFSGITNILGSTSPVFNHISVVGTLNSPSSLLLTGNLINSSGNFVAGTGTVVFQGTTTQNIQGTPIIFFNNITVTNTATIGLSFESNENLNGILTLGANVRVDADGAANNTTLTVKSYDDNPAQDASIAQIPGNSQVQGNVTVQRYMSMADHADRFISSPVTNAPVSQLQDDFPVTGEFTGTSYPCDGCVNNGESLKYYVESVTGPFANGYTSTPVIGGTNAETLVPGRGYDVWMWNSIGPDMMDLRGPINQGTINFTVTRTPNSQPLADGWNLIGNPYPSAIQWRANGNGWSKTNIDPVVWVWDVQDSVWLSSNEAGVGTLTNGRIATGQAFWIYVPAVGAASLSVNESAKTPTANAYHRERTNNVAGIDISLASGRVSDHAYIIFSELSEVKIGSPKLQLGIESMSLSLVDVHNNKLAYYPANEEMEADIPISVTAKSGGFEFTFTSMDARVDMSKYFLVDKYLQTITPITQSHSFSITQNQQSAEGRFLLTKNSNYSFDQKNSEGLVVSCYPNPAREAINIEVNSNKVTDIVLLNNTGQMIRSVDFSESNGITTGKVNTESLPSGFYFVKIVTGKKFTYINKIFKY